MGILGTRGIQERDDPEIGPGIRESGDDLQTSDGRQLERNDDDRRNGGEDAGPRLGSLRRGSGDRPAVSRQLVAKTIEQKRRCDEECDGVVRHKSECAGRSLSESCGPNKILSENPEMLRRPAGNVTV